MVGNYNDRSNFQHKLSLGNLNFKFKLPKNNLCIFTKTQLSIIIQSGGFLLLMDKLMALTLGLLVELVKNKSILKQDTIFLIINL